MPTHVPTISLALVASKGAAVVVVAMVVVAVVLGVMVIAALPQDAIINDSAIRQVPNIHNIFRLFNWHPLLFRELSVHS